jgi:hypothetical protein
MAHKKYTGYFVFCEAERPAVKRELQHKLVREEAMASSGWRANVRASAVMYELGERWSALTSLERSLWRRQAEVLKEAVLAREMLAATVAVCWKLVRDAYAPKCGAFAVVSFWMNEVGENQGGLDGAVGQRALSEYKQWAEAA